MSWSREEQEPEQEPWVVRQGSGVGELQAFMPCTCRQSHFNRQLIGLCNQVHWLVQGSSLACATLTNLTHNLK